MKQFYEGARAGGTIYMWTEALLGHKGARCIAHGKKQFYEGPRGQEA